jgi:hypothetical protein
VGNTNEQTREREGDMDGGMYMDVSQVKNFEAIEESSRKKKAKRDDWFMRASTSIAWVSATVERGGGSSYGCGGDSQIKEQTVL